MHLIYYIFTFILSKKLPLSHCVIDDVVELAEQMTNPVLLKDNQGKYLYANPSSVRLFGFSHQNELIGINARELNCKIEHRWHAEYNKTVSDLDNFVVKQRKTGKDLMRVLPCQDGTLRVQNMMKNPMVSQFSDKVTSVFTFSENLTDNVDRITLLNLYVKFYTAHESAIRYFLKYLSVDPLFVKCPSLREMETILLLAVFANHKAVSNKMGISVRTVEENIRKIKQNKLKDEYLWTVLLELIRNEKRNIKIT
ncbi:hypothetical protein VA7868_03556 [Vibrio aerogenes CECT 7868]|uniref:PAS domain-containing protein n=1 Tax=Vibrio aerogenes CECT 7868 TaxID=1216006 RepID=A0A1M6AEG0_9VIBR|nr:PAS domain-containing protein [Vibrio aerogenes]SHI34849.1 hypothetical protein VA7868_03556 [Vibrio aerogenes CECT 7868]